MLLLEADYSKLEENWLRCKLPHVFSIDYQEIESVVIKLAKEYKKFDVFYPKSKKEKEKFLKENSQLWGEEYVEIDLELTDNESDSDYTLSEN